MNTEKEKSTELHNEMLKLISDLSEAKTLDDVKAVYTHLLRNGIACRDNALLLVQTLNSFEEKAITFELKVRYHNEFNTNEAHYEPLILRSGTLVYVSKEKSDETSNEHYFCPCCYSKRQIAPLSHMLATKYSPERFICGNCGNTLII